MKIDHLAIWTKDLEKTKEFYIRYFQAQAGDKYVNPVKKFESYFLSFHDGCRLELMKIAGIQEHPNIEQQFTGLAHFSISIGSKQQVDAMTDRLRRDGYSIVGEPRTTGDGYYESVVLDPEGNRIEITV